MSKTDQTIFRVKPSVKRGHFQVREASPEEPAVVDRDAIFDALKHGQEVTVDLTQLVLSPTDATQG